MDINTTEALMVAFYGSAAILLAYAAIAKLIRIDMAERKDQVRREDFIRRDTAARTARENCPKCGKRAMSNPDCSLCDDDYWEKKHRDANRI
jgi:hypothetical protein